MPQHTATPRRPRVRRSDPFRLSVTYGPDDVALDILYCGVCHSDLHTARNEWHKTQYPWVPGHEIVGR